MDREEQFKSVIDLKVLLDHGFFKAFVAHYSFPQGINNTHMKTLMMLHFNPSVSMVDLSRMLNLEKGSFTPVAGKLLRLGYIVKNQNPDDRRAFLLNLTGKGEDAANAFKKSHMEYIGSLIETIDPKDKEKFFESVQCINNIMRAFTKFE